MSHSVVIKYYYIIGKAINFDYNCIEDDLSGLVCLIKIDFFVRLSAFRWLYGLFVSPLHLHLPLISTIRCRLFCEYLRN